MTPWASVHVVVSPLQCVSFPLIWGVVSVVHGELPSVVGTCQTFVYIVVLQETVPSCVR